jgi:hypothetical protein
VNIEQNEFESTELIEGMTDEVIFEHLSESFVMLENLISGASTAKHNLEKIFEMLDSIKSITEDLKNSVMAIQSISEVSRDLVSISDILKDLAVEERKMISAVSLNTTEQKKINIILTENSKNNIVNFKDNKIKNPEKKDSKLNILFLYFLGLSNFSVMLFVLYMIS